MTHALVILLIGSYSGVLGGDAYDRNRWVGRAIWAAAPELLAALQAFMPELDQRERFISANDSAWSASELQMLDRIRKARAAIAKAERTS